jgi:hypothetical protein
MNAKYEQKESVTVDRNALAAEIEATRAAFRTVLVGLPEVRWSARAPGSKWNGRQLLEHITWSLEQLPREVECAKRGKGMFNFPGLLADTGSYWMVKWSARKATPEALLGRYEDTIARVLRSLEGVEADEWSRGARFYGERFYSVEDLFHTPAAHFQEHAALLALPSGRQ